MHVYTEQQLKHSGTQNTLKGPQAVRCNTEARKKKKKVFQTEYMECNHCKNCNQVRVHVLSEVQIPQNNKYSYQVQLFKYYFTPLLINLS